MKEYILKSYKTNNSNIFNIFEDFYALLDKSFPPYEKRSYNNQKKLLTNPYYEILTFSVDDKLVGIMAIWDFSDFVYLEHFAVDPDCRNLGIGKKMLEKAIEYKKMPFVLETELPLNDMAARRINFYKRCNFTLYTFDYKQPPLNEGDNDTPLMIMSTKNNLTSKAFEIIKDTLYSAVYNVEAK